MATRTSITTIASVVLAVSSMAGAYGQGRSTPREGACFYEDADYRGDYFCVESGDEVSSIPSGANDRVSSIRIFGRVDVTVFKDSRFRGETLRVDASVRDLDDEDFNDTISSIQIERRSGGGRPPFGSGSGASPERIIRRAYQDILEREPDPVGMRTYRSRIIDDGWTEEQVRDSLRRSAEYREKQTMTRAKAEAIVRKAYLSVLKREPDPASQGYIDRVFRDKWTQQDVERELRKSPEYRNRPR